MVTHMETLAKSSEEKTRLIPNYSNTGIWKKLAEASHPVTSQQGWQVCTYRESVNAHQKQQSFSSEGVLGLQETDKAQYDGLSSVKQHLWLST